MNLLSSAVRPWSAIDAWLRPHNSFPQTLRSNIFKFDNIQLAGLEAIHNGDPFQALLSIANKSDNELTALILKSQSPNDR
ncbi:MAG: hypothetical protein WBL74_10270 [Novosphingobium sp.]|uniref:hypothetical protein n=1 Tax=Novosphingobium sp. TaxID=1874826 RepID=UPI003C7B6FB5